MKINWSNKKRNFKQQKLLEGYLHEVFSFSNSHFSTQLNVLVNHSSAAANSLLFQLQKRGPLFCFSSDKGVGFVLVAFCDQRPNIQAAAAAATAATAASTTKTPTTTIATITAKAAATTAAAKGDSLEARSLIATKQLQPKTFHLEGVQKQERGISVTEVPGNKNFAQKLDPQKVIQQLKVFCL